MTFYGRGDDSGEDAVVVRSDGNKAILGNTHGDAGGDTSIHFVPPCNSGDNAYDANTLAYVTLPGYNGTNMDDSHVTISIAQSSNLDYNFSYNEFHYITTNNDHNHGPYGSDNSYDGSVAEDYQMVITTRTYGGNHIYKINSTNFVDGGGVVGSSASCFNGGTGGPNNDGYGQTYEFQTSPDGDPGNPDGPAYDPATPDQLYSIQPYMGGVDKANFGPVAATPAMLYQ